MATCQNGWPASPNKEAIVPFTVAGVSFPGGVRGGDVETAMRYVAEQWHARVERLRAGWCWGWAYRAVRGATDLSNHAGGYALDFNAPDHPLGKVGTYSGAQVGQIHAVLGEVGGVIRWGGDYSGRKDEMHIEVVGSQAAVAAVAARLRGGGVGPAAPTPPPAPASGQLLRRGSTGDAVKALQARLNRDYPAYSKLSVDGIFGPGTEAVVKEFQRRAGLAVDGIAGPKTLAALHLA